MSSSSNPFTNWKSWIEQILRPQPPEHLIHEKLEAIRSELPPPVIWLLGKTQSGKSSLIRTLTGSTQAEIGNGFRPCTRTAMLFDYPDPDTAFIRFLDTRGLAEAGYDPSEDMHWCDQQAHLLIVVMKAMDQQQSTVINTVRRIHKTHPGKPVIVVQTALHEGYPDNAYEHVLPYPFDNGNIDPAVPPDLRCSLLKQREDFKDIKASFIPVDFTTEEEGYDPADYGIDALWQSIEDIFPYGIKAMLEQNSSADDFTGIHWHSAHPHIIGYAVSAGLAAAIPVPAASITSVVTVQAKMFHSIAHVYGLPLTRQSLSEISSAIGVGVLAGLGGRELMKFIPIYGQSVGLGISALYTAGVTYGLGKTLCYYFAQSKRGGSVNPELLRKVYQSEFERGRLMLRKRFKRTPSS
ncbi:GTP-binding DUF697 domain-containing protein [Methylicorpusculum oleiharenae]|uniref:GTPase family protein n=1 Tax=Methylicorpusculum oleiharenae TaxID=1338687 RepID=UPI00135BBE29|nr:GTPase [Methylicorpusculum oleiharenae]MCD2453112.1 GTP-binding DUF697 domain-containing protein [Methylicorpusculum oleiharenae]